MTYVLHQCRFGSPAVKPTGIWTVDFGVKSLAPKCNHKTQHMMAIGLAQAGSFKTTPLAKYPGLLCQALAERTIYWLVRRHGDRPGASLPQLRAIGEAAARDARAGSPWANRLFPPILVETCRSSVPGCAAHFQLSTMSFCNIAVARLTRSLPRIKIGRWPTRFLTFTKILSRPRALRVRPSCWLRAAR